MKHELCVCVCGACDFESICGGDCLLLAMLRLQRVRGVYILYSIVNLVGYARDPIINIGAPKMFGVYSIKTFGWARASKMGMKSRVPDGDDGGCTAPNI